MLEPLAFVPKHKLFLEASIDDAVCIELIADSEPIIAPLDVMRSLLAVRYSLAPKWTSWEDGRGGSLSVVDKEGNKLGMALLDEADTLVTPYSTDGMVIHEGEFALFTLGAKLGRENGVLWGFLSHPLEALQENSARVRAFHSHLDSDLLRQCFEFAYPS